MNKYWYKSIGWEWLEMGYDPYGWWFRLHIGYFGFEVSWNRFFEMVEL